MFFDIETDLNCSQVWLIGTLLDGVFNQFFANAFDEEVFVLEEFKQLVETAQPQVLCSYSGMEFDQRVLLGAFNRHGIPPPPLLPMNHVDLLREIQDAFILPSPSYGLKPLGETLGYKFHHRDLDGYQVALAYQSHHQHEEPLDLRVFDYNKDDVYALQFLSHYLLKPRYHTVTRLSTPALFDQASQEHPQGEVESPLVDTSPLVNTRELGCLIQITPKDIEILHEFAVDEPKDLLKLSPKRIKNLKRRCTNRAVDLWFQQAARWAVYTNEL